MRPVEIVQRVAPKARLEYVTAFFNGDALFEKYKVNTPLRMAHFLAQVLAETGGLAVTWENMSYSASRIIEVFGVGHHSAKVTATEAKQLANKPAQLAERVYGLGNPSKARELGNVKAGDGYRLRGGGIMQTTGGYNYKKYGTMFGIDLYNHPELILSAEHALKPALAEWDHGNCNAYADKNDILSISKIINLGNAQTTKIPNGMADRQSWFNKVWPICRDNGVNLIPGSVQLPVPPPATPAAPSTTGKTLTTGGVVAGGVVAATQAHAAGFGVLAIAGIVFGAVCVAAVVWIVWSRLKSPDVLAPALVGPAERATPTVAAGPVIGPDGEVIPVEPAAPIITETDRK
jgi:putative chitinase